MSETEDQFTKSHLRKKKTEAGSDSTSISKIDVLKANGRILVFGSDFEAYHLHFIRGGIQSYFEHADRSISYVNLDIPRMVNYFGKSVGDRLVIIGNFRTREAIEFFLEKNIPFFNLIDTEPKSPLRFDVKFEGEGAIAANYFIEEMNLENLGFVGHTPLLSHQRRLQEFKHEASRSSVGVDLEILQLPVERTQKFFYDLDYENILVRKQQINDFLLKIRKPAGIFCADDMIAFDLCYAAELLGIKVPEEIAILGVGSRDERKEPWARSVSVVQLDHHKFGQTAARLMDEYWKTGEMPKSVRLRPDNIRQSQTTFRRAVGDPLVRKALQRIQKEPSLSVVQLCDELGISRAALDVRFRRAANMTVTKALEMERFIQAKRLIRGRNHYSLEAIASLAGYPSRKVMRRSFYRFTRMNPQQFRESNADDI